MIGIVFQDNSLDSELDRAGKPGISLHGLPHSARRTSRAHQRLAGLDGTDRVQRSERQDLFGRDAPPPGNRTRVAARAAFDVLDEPTVGLDPQTRNYIWQYVRDLREGHHTAIFMTTHYMDEAENCDRIAIIDKGQIVALDTPAELKKMVGDDQIELTTRMTTPASIQVIQRALSDARRASARVRWSFEVPSAEHFAPRLLAELPALTDGVTLSRCICAAPAWKMFSLSSPDARSAKKKARKINANSVSGRRGRILRRITWLHNRSPVAKRQRLLHTAAIWKSFTAFGCAT